MDLLEKMASLPIENLLQIEVPDSQQTQALFCLSERYWPFKQNNHASNLILSPHHFHDAKELVIFGGSFSPWHEGHAHALRALKAIRPDCITVVCPDWNPQKSHRSDLNNGWERWVSLNKTIHHDFPEIPIYPGLLTWQRPTPTSHWLPEIKYETKSMLIGADSFYGMLNWIMPNKLLSTLNSIYVLPREDHEDEFEAMKTKILQTLLQSQNLKIIRLPHHPYEKVSSTILRKQIIKN